MCRQHLQGLLRFHKPELNLSKWPLAQRMQRVQALKTLAGWCSGQKLALNNNNNNRKKQIKEKWLWFSAGQNVRHTFLLTQTVKQHRSRSLQFQKSWSSTPHVLPREIFKNHSNTEGSSELLSPCRRESADLQRLCVVERQTLSEADQIWQRDHWGRRCQVSPQPSPPAASVQRALPPSSQNNDLPSGQRF